MPRVARFAITSIEDLCRQLRYAPDETRMKQMNAAEDFAAGLELDQLYPEDFVIFRITGYRPKMDNPALLVGEALLGDLANFVQRLSDGLDLPPDYRGRRALQLDDVASRLNVASKTIQRYRKRGLVCHYVLFGEDDLRLACFEDALARFVNGHESQVARAGEFSRIERNDVDLIVAEARSLRVRRRCSLNETALELSKKHGRTHETIRMILRKHDQRSEQPIFAERGPLTERDGRVLYRAWRRGVPIAAMAERFGRTPTTIHRAINRRRGQLLGDLGLCFVELPTFARDDAAGVILAVPAVRDGLDQLLPRHDALALFEAAKKVKVDADAEIALLAAYNLLKRRAAAAIAAFGPWPGAAELDCIETDLRWAGRIKRRLVCLGLPTALRRIEQHLHRPLHEHSAERIVAAIRAAVSIVSGVVESLDPSKRQRLPRVVGYAADRALARDDALTHVPGRAAARHGSGSIPLADPFAGLTPWDEFVEPPIGLADLALELRDTEMSRLLQQRYGWNGEQPRTIADLAQARNQKRSVLARILCRAEAELLTIRRHASNAT